MNRHVVVPGTFTPQGRIGVSRRTRRAMAATPVAGASALVGDRIQCGSAAMTRRTFKPTAEQRRCVETMIGINVPEAEICRQIKNPVTDKPIDLETLRKYFAAEIAFGAAKMKLLTFKFIHATILGHEGGLADEEARGRLLLFYAKTRLGWNRRVSRHEKVGGAIDTQQVQQEVSHELDRLARRRKAGETGGSSEA